MTRLPQMLAGMLLVVALTAVHAETIDSRFDPDDFAPLDTVSAGETATFDTTAATASIDGGPTLNGVFSNVSGRAIAVFCFSNVYLSSTVTITGTNGIAILSQQAMTVDTTIDISGGDGTTADPGSGVCGGFNGNKGGRYAGGPKYPANANENGPGYGDSPTANAAAGGGAGYGADGGKGAPPATGGAGGTNYASSAVAVLWGGSGGAGGSGNNHVGHGGAGGGALELSSVGDLDLGSSAHLYADGGLGCDKYYCGGGGSGGSLLLASEGTIDLASGALLSAPGGRGGNAIDSGYGGGGGAGGRVALYALTFLSNGTVDVTGGAGGTSVSSTNADPGADGTFYFEQITTELPLIENTTATNMALDAASLVGTLTSTGMAVTTVHLFWDTTDRTTNMGLWVGSTNLGHRAEDEVITNRVTGLSTNTLYYFRFYATNSYGGRWAQPSMPFTTLGEPGVDNASGATDIGLDTAKLNGTLTNGTSADIWIYWGTNDGLEAKGSWNTNEYLGSKSEGPFWKTISGLQAGQVYYYRSYASNAVGYAWAQSSSIFTTKTTTFVTLDRDPVGQFEKLEMTISNAASYTNPFDPTEVDTYGNFTSPTNRQLRVNAFWDGAEWKLRFAGAETGQWSYTVYIKDASGTNSQAGTFTVTNAPHHGWIRTSSEDPHYLEHYNGTSFYGVGFCKPWYVTNDLFINMRTNGCNIFTYWLATWDGKELVNLGTGYDRYEMTNAAEVDVILEAAETNDVKMLFTVWYHGLLRDSSHPWGNEQWSDNPFKNLTSCPDFFTDTNSWHYQQRFYRYVIARWGYSRALGTWHLVAEIEGTTAGSNADSWHEKLYNYFHTNDPFGHVAGGSSAHVADWPGGYSVMDAPQVHNYEGAQDEIGIGSNVASITHRLFNDYEKPNFHGEFGKRVAYGETARMTYQHNGVWAGLASGAAITPLMWNDGGDWGNQTAAMYQQMKHFRNFVDTVDISHQGFDLADVTTSFSGGDVHGIDGKEACIVWLQDRSPGETVSGETVTVNGLVRGDYIVGSYSTWNGTWLNITTTRVEAGSLAIDVPDFTNDVAFRVFAYDTSVDLPVINNAEGVSGIGLGTATLNGTLTSTGTAPTVVSVFWGPSDGGTNVTGWANTNYFGTNATPVPVSYSTNLTGLATNQVYYYRYYAANSNGDYWATTPEIFMISEVQIRTSWTNAAEAGRVPGTVVVYRASAATSIAQVVTYSLIGDATDGVDYHASPTGSVTLLTGQTEAQVVFTPVDDRIDEPLEEIDVRLTGDDYVLGVSSNAIVTIEDDEEPLDFGDWNYRMPITFENYSQPQPLTNFPALVLFTSNRVTYGQFLADGADLRFADTNDIEIFYEIEGWNIAPDGDSLMWVQVPILTSNTVIYAYWGNPDAAMPAYTTNGIAWAPGYEGVWHVKENQAGTGTSDVYHDSTTNRNHGDDLVSATNKSGVIDGGQRFDGNDYIDCGNDASLGITNVLTMEAWVNVSYTNTTWTNMQVISKKSYWTNAAGFELELNTGNGWITVLGGSWNYARCAFSWDTGAWHHVAAAVNDTICQIYIDGQPATMISNILGVLVADNTELAIGRRPQDSEYPSWMRGFVDEVRVSSVLRSDDYMWACYMNQASNDFFVSYGAVGAWDWDGDDIWDGWESNYWGNLTTTDGGTNQDYDNDGFLDINEYLAGCHPTNGDSNLRFDQVEYVDGIGYVIHWFSESNREYQVLYSTNLLYGFQDLISNIAATPPENVYTDAVPAVTRRRLYKVRVEDEDL